MKHAITVTVNGRVERLEVESRTTVLELVRDHLKLFGAREGCGVSMCGACTVLVDGMLVSGCSALAARLDGRTLTTIEGLSSEGLGAGGELHPVQQAFLDEGGFQCSYCTPGMILTTVALLAENPAPTNDEIREYLVGNLCRCGAYPEILRAVQRAVTVLGSPSPQPSPIELGGESPPRPPSAAGEGAGPRPDFPAELGK